MAVKRVTSNKGKRTAGGDKVKWTTPTAKLKAALSLKRKGYKPKPLKKVYIDKSSGKKRLRVESFPQLLPMQSLMEWKSQ